MENLFIGMLITLFLAIIIAATAILVFKSQQKEDYPIKEDEGIVFLVVLLNIAKFCFNHAHVLCRGCLIIIWTGLSIKIGIAQKA